MLDREAVLLAAESTRPRHEVRIDEDDGQAALLVDGVVQSISLESVMRSGGYWAFMVPGTYPKDALILGLGGGTLAALLRIYWKPDRIVGVDDNLDVIETARDAGWLDIHGLEVVQANAFDFVQTCTETFDYVAIDLYRGEQMPRRTFGRPFLRRVAQLLKPDGSLAVNLLRDYGRLERIDRIGEFFMVHKVTSIRGNVVVHAYGNENLKGIFAAYST